MTMQAGCFLSTLYVKGMIIIIAAGGAERERRERRLMKDANSVAGR